MGDVLSLIEEAEQKVDKKQAERLARKIKKGKGFDLEDFKEQLKQMQNMGGVASIMEKMPGMARCRRVLPARLTILNSAGWKLSSTR